MDTDRVRKIRERLEAAFSPELLDITDDSHLHAGHAGARSGKGHFSVVIVSNAFRDTLPLERHRMVFDALGNLMLTDIHALSISTSVPKLDNSSSKTRDPHENAPS
jgi:BolA protein